MSTEIPNHDSLLIDPLYRSDWAEDEDVSNEEEAEADEADSFSDDDEVY